MKSLKKIIVTFILLAAISISFSYKSDFFEIAKQIEIYTTLFKELNLYYIDEINPADVMDRAIENTLKDLDPYTRFYDEQGVENVRIAAEGEYGGIGASISFNEGNLMIREVYQDYPAHLVGLLPGDEITKIDETILKEHDEEFVRSLLKGLPNSTLKVEVLRQNEIKKFTLTRETVEINPVPFYVMVDDEVGYISFVEFNKKASAEVKKAFLDLKSQGMKKVIIDVRHNPGGLLNEAVNIVNFFIPKDKIVVTTRAKLEKWSTTFKTKKEPIDTEIPITIIIDNRSASASEILAGALQDYDRAVIVGQRSFGKGLVQRSRKLSYGTQLKLTISKYYTPSGRCIQELDYTNRNLETGEIPKFSDGNVSSFKTTNGRTVYNGGGVTPDVLIDHPALTASTKKMLSSDAFFNFITNYYFQHKEVLPANIFEVDTTIYQDLKIYLKEHSDQFLIETELALQKIEEISEKETVELGIDYQNLLNQISLQKIASLDNNKEEIMELLTTGIVRRYYFKEGEYQYKMNFDKEIKGAVELLNNPNKYAQQLN